MLNLKSCLRDIANKIKTFDSKFNSLGHIGVNCTARGNASTQSLPNTTVTTITLNTWVQGDSGFSFSNGGVKVPYSGTVLVTGSVYIATSATSDSAGCFLKLNGSEFSSQYYYGGRGSTFGGAKIITVNAGDVITLCGRVTPARNAIPNNAATYLSICYIK